MATFRVDVDGKSVTDEIRRRIKAGISDGAGEVEDELRAVAKQKIRDEKALWRRELINGFAGSKVKFGDSTVTTLRNHAPHASYQEHGVSGTEKKRDSPHEYTTKKPPLSDLIPWVRSNLSGTGFWPDDLPGDGPPGSSGSSRRTQTSASTATGSGGTTKLPKRNPNHDPLMGADDLSKGTEVIYRDSHGNATSGTIHQVFDNFRADYTVRRWDEDREEWLYAEVRAEDIANFDGRGALPEDVVAGETVYVGHVDRFGEIAEKVTDPDTGEVTGAWVEFDDGFRDLLDLSQFEIAIGVPRMNQYGVPIDANGLYAGEDGFWNIGIDDEWDTFNTFPFQKVVVFNRLKKEYEYGYVTGYSFIADDHIRVGLERQQGGMVDIPQSNTGDYRLVGAEDWDLIPESDKKEHLRQYFDSFIRNNEREILDNSAANDDWSTLSDSRLDDLINVMTGRVWDEHRDDHRVKEMIRNWRSAVKLSDDEANDGVAGGVITYQNTTNFSSYWRSRKQVTDNNRDQDWYEDEVIRHESEHMLSKTENLDTLVGAADAKDTAKYASFSRTGTELSGRRLDPDGDVIEIPDDATYHMFHDADGNLIGDTDWIPKAYDEIAVSNEPLLALARYGPKMELTAPESQPVSRLHEAANKAYWLQLLVATEGWPEGKRPNNKASFFVQRLYSIAGAEETLATFHAMFGSTYMDAEKQAERIKQIHRYYPWLIEAWLGVHNPPEHIEQLLTDLGYTL